MTPSRAVCQFYTLHIPDSSIIAEIFTRLRDDEILGQNRKLGMRDPSLASRWAGVKNN